MRFSTNFTFTDPKTDPPSLTPWGLEKFKEAKDSNGGNYTLDQTNDPVLTKCYPAGVPRVYFDPYPFEFVHTPKYTLLIDEYDHWLRRIYTDSRPLPRDPDLPRTLARSTSSTRSACSCTATTAASSVAGQAKGSR